SQRFRTVRDSGQSEIPGSQRFRAVRDSGQSEIPGRRLRLSLAICLLASSHGYFGNFTASARIPGETLQSRCPFYVTDAVPSSVIRPDMHTTPEPSTRLRLSLAACALVVATSTAEATVRPATGIQADAAIAGQLSESAILRKVQSYCLRSWLNAGIPRQDWDDCTQDVYLRLLSRLPGNELSIAIDEPDSVARRELNRAVWATSQRCRRARVHTSLTTETPSPTGPVTYPEHSESVQLIRHAIESADSNLSPIQRQIVTQWSNGEAIRTIAENLSMSPARVSDDKYKAIQKLRRRLSTGIALH
ncbi:MAG: sigma-70 family RNA polymerase sigma factor, partial [Planctomycetaceae bacterium]